MPEIPTRQGMFDILGAIFHIPTAWCQGSPIYLRTVIIISIYPNVVQVVIWLEVKVGDILAQDYLIRVIQHRQEK